MRQKRMAAVLLGLSVSLFLTGFGWETKCDVNVRQGPGVETEKLGRLKRGEELCVMQQQDGWGKIIYQGREAYVSMHYLEELDYEVPLKLTYEEPPVINVLGDSITYGNLLASQSEAYPEVLEQLLGATVHNYGVCATTIAINNEDSFLERYRSMEADADLILVMGGTNDFGLSTPLGSEENRTPSSFYGGMLELLAGLKAKYPGVPIIFLTPLQREKEEFPNQQGQLLEDYVAVIREICAQQGVYVLDLFAEESLNFRESMEQYMPDGLHPNQAGHQLIAEYIYHNLFAS